MLLILYVYVAGAIAFGIYLVMALLNDITMPNNHKDSWYFLVLATILWPVALPSVLWKKLFAKSVDQVTENLR